VVEVIVGSSAAGRGGRVVTPNVSILRQTLADPELVELVNSATLVVADGAPIVWALRLNGTPVPERVAGSSVAEALMAPAASAGVGVFLLGAPPGCAQAAAERFRSELPGLRIGYHCPPQGFERDAAAMDTVRARLTEFGPAITLCGLGFPRQDRLGAALADELPTSWFLGVGSSIEFLAGRVRRAPVWMQRSGLEWVHRLALDPRRLGRRYSRDAAFAVSLLGGAVVARGRR
jgi:N-acetylglucosaminyldiphosphoundecaprenol N-acetyl-beta-D-mannosaminyltransferase